MKTSCEIRWDNLTPQEWESRFRSIPRSNLLQSYEYACAVGSKQGLQARRGIIAIGGREAGLVQILEAGILKNALHAVILDRGPLWFEGSGGLTAPATRLSGWISGRIRKSCGPT